MDSYGYYGVVVPRKGIQYVYLYRPSLFGYRGVLQCRYDIYLSIGVGRVIKL